MKTMVLRIQRSTLRFSLQFYVTVTDFIHSDRSFPLLIYVCCTSNLILLTLIYSKVDFIFSKTGIGEKMVCLCSVFIQSHHGEPAAAPAFGTKT